MSLAWYANAPKSELTFLLLLLPLPWVWHCHFVSGFPLLFRPPTSIQVGFFNFHLSTDLLYSISSRWWPLNKTTTPDSPSKFNVFEHTCYNIFRDGKQSRHLIWCGAIKGSCHQVFIHSTASQAATSKCPVNHYGRCFWLSLPVYSSSKALRQIVIHLNGTLVTFTAQAIPTIKSSFGP